MINGTEPKAPEILPIAEMLTHVAGLAQAREEAGQQFRCVALIMVDQNGDWAGAVGGDHNMTNFAELLQTVRDDVVRGGQGISVFIKQDEPTKDPPMTDSVPIGVAMNDEA